METEARRDRSRSPLVVATTFLGAIGVLAGGLLHLEIWDSDYRDIPDGAVKGLNVVKLGFPAEAALSVALFLVLLVVAFRIGPLIRSLALPAALALQLGSIGALVLSRSSSIFGWSETGWSGEAKQVLTVEIATSAVLVAAGAAQTLFSRSSRNRTT